MHHTYCRRDDHAADCPPDVLRLSFRFKLLSMIFSDLASPAEASTERASRWQGFAQVGNRYPFFGIML
jgi:hypothetical protein